MEDARAYVARGLRSSIGCLYVSFPALECGLVLDNADMSMIRGLVRPPPSSFPSEPLKLSLLPPSLKRATR